MAKQKDQIPAKMCFSHIGGKLGTMLLEAYLDKGWLARNSPGAKHFYITAKGQKEFTKLGIDLGQIER